MPIYRFNNRNTIICGFDIDITEDVLLDQEYGLILEKYYERCHIQKERLKVYYP